MEVGRMDKRIKVWKMSESQNPTGEVLQKALLLAEIWGSIEPIAGREYFTGDQHTGASTTRMRIRHMDGLTRKMIVTYQRLASDPKSIDYYEIDAVLPIRYERREMQLMCTQKDAQNFRLGGFDG